MDYFVHDTVDEVSDDAEIGKGTKVWHGAQVREGAVVGEDCVIGKNAYIDLNVRVGDKVKVSNNVSVYRGVTLEEGVFVGPHACFTNDMFPRAINPDGSLKDAADWSVSETLVKKGASIGANATIVCGVTIGEWALVGAGTVVTRDVPPHALFFGVPGKVRGFVCYCATKLEKKVEEANTVIMRCPRCDKEQRIPKKDYDLID